MLETLQEYLSYPFVQYALIVGVLIALCAAVLGVTLVLKRFSFIGDGLSHVAFGAMAIAAVLNLTNNMVVILPVTVICAIFILNKGKNAKLKGDARHCGDICRRARDWLYADEYLFNFEQRRRRRLQLALWLDGYFNAEQFGYVALRDIIDCRIGVLRLVL